jgi:tRNA-intron endonuclease
MGAFLVENRIIVDDEPTITKLHQKGFGERENNRLELSLLEGLFLIERGSLTVREKKGGREVTADDIIERVQEEDFHIKYKVYKDLRERGLVVRTGLKFGAHFRVYDRGDFPKKHSKYLVHAVPESRVLEFPEVSRAVRLAQGVKKNMIFAIVDDEGDVTYYSIERVTP